MSDRPWGATLGSIAARQLTGELVVHTDDKPHRISFLRGTVVAASSPLIADSAARVAMTCHLVSSTQVAALARRIAAEPEREIELVAESARLSADQVELLRRRLLVQRVARTFAIERGSFSFEAAITLPVAPPAVALGAAIYLGARMHLSEARLAADLGQLGTRFVLRACDSARYGFTDREQPLLDALRTETSLAELDARLRELEPRTMQAAIYALVATGACDARDPQEVPVPQVAEPVPTPAAEAPPIARSRTITFEAPTSPGRSPLAGAQPTRTTAPTGPIAATGPAIPRTVTPRRSQGHLVRETIAAGIALVEQGADHFRLLGLPTDASQDSLRSAYVRFACQLHPDKLPELGVAETRDAHRLFAQVNLAFAVLNDPVRRAEYLAGLQRGPLEARPTARVDAAADRVRLAEQAFQRGMAALRREDLMVAIEELTRATQLAPADVDHQAGLAWARFCASSDKQGIAPETRRTLERAIFKSPNPVMAWLYLGRVERMLGRLHQALHHFREVIELEPGHPDAAAEIRAIEPRIAARR
ncbi:MAG: DnaJ domain-containing protein [Kofleriaceae bacterium]